MNGCDVLGQEGRKALDACVKVKIYGRPQTRLYDYNSTIERLEKCFGGKYPDGFDPLYRRILKRDASNIEQALMDESIIEKMLLPSLRDNYGIIDIYESLVHLDNTPYVEKYPAVKGTDSDKRKNSIDKRREDVEREVREATANPDERHRYSWLVAQRRVRDCFAGSFAGDASLLERKTTAAYMYKNHDLYERRKKEISTPDTYSISDIYKAFRKHDSVSVSKNIENLSCQRCQVSEEVKKQRDDVDTEYQQAVTVSSASTSIQKHHKYSREEAFH